MPINLPPVNQRETESKEREILNAFLTQFFTGAEHTDDDGNPAIFPQCVIAFNQTDVRSLTLPLIHWNFANRQTTRQPGDGGMIVQTDCLSTVLVQVNTEGRMDTADHTCADVASNLMELLHCTQRLQLAQLGISRCRVQRGPVPLIMPGLRTRLLVVSAHLEYTIPRLAA